MKKDRWTTAYKLVRKGAEGWRSACLQLPDEIVCHYEIGEETYPSIEGSLLFAFKSEKAARLANWGGNWAVFECLALNSRPIHYYAELFHSKSWLEQLWQDRRSHRRLKGVFARFEEGEGRILGAEAIKLVRQIG